MKEESEAILLRIYIGEKDRHGSRLLYEEIIEHLRKEGFAGTTILRGIAGFGKNSLLHTANLLRLSEDLPLVIEIVESQENIKKIKAYLDTVLKDGLLTEEKVKIVRYRDETETEVGETPPFV